ncbi:hypothetical protein Pmi06nite_80620 [Planotetraspora mira]|uniref:Uncharacterized protein n=1 Tax=Planotetraspora mira TaxID=58121 RepID=A0A8J3U8S8_9ACTN|nr:hypothetical protein Pmi06nite_80620 [Planotetraspora mira]
MPSSLMMLVLCFKGLWPPRPGATNVWRWRRLGADGQVQEWQVSFTGTRIQETWTANGAVHHDAGPALGGSSLAEWFMTRSQELHDAGWRVVSVGIDMTVSPQPVAGSGRRPTRQPLGGAAYPPQIRG